MRSSRPAEAEPRGPTARNPRRRQRRLVAVRSAGRGRLRRLADRARRGRHRGDPIGWHRGERSGERTTAARASARSLAVGRVSRPGSAHCDRVRARARLRGARRYPRRLRPRRDRRVRAERHRQRRALRRPLRRRDRLRRSPDVHSHGARPRRNALGAGRLVFGAHPDADRCPPPLAREIDALQADFAAAGFDVAVSPRIAEDKWLKLCVNLMSVPNALIHPDEHTTADFVEIKARLLEEAPGRARGRRHRRRLVRWARPQPGRRDRLPARLARRRPECAEAADLQRGVALTRARCPARGRAVPRPHPRARPQPRNTGGDERALAHPRPARAARTARRRQRALQRLPRGAD